MTYYEILGITESATAQEIKTSYRNLAKKYHPDLNSAPDAAEKFIEIEVAYSNLSKPAARAQYDKLLQFQRSRKVHPNVTRKYEYTVERNRSKAARSARSHAHMSYKQYQTDEMLRTSFAELLIKSGLAILTAVVLGWIFLNIVDVYTVNGEIQIDFVVLAGLGGLMVVALAGITYLYEPLVKYILVGKPKGKSKKDK